MSARVSEASQGGKSAQRPVGRSLVLAAAAALAGAACGDNGTAPPDTLRFGQIGSVVITLEAPLRLGVGTLTQELRWGSSGQWSLAEAISYNGVTGDDTFVRNPGDPGLSAGAYAEFIHRVNEVEGLSLDAVSRDSVPGCGETRTRVTLVLVDDVRAERKSWTQCGVGSLANLTPAGAGPDADASRLMEAALAAKRATVGLNFASAYAGSVPFATIDRGDHTPSNVRNPLALTTPEGWAAFWADHAPSRPLPAVDFGTQMVLVGVVGESREAGDSVEVRRILQVDVGTLTHVVERVPGDFCSPAARAHVPYHIVVAPRTPEPLRFAEIQREEITCG